MEFKNENYVRIGQKENTDTAVFYMHGKGGAALEAGYYEKFFPEYEIIGMDYQSNTPWEAKEEIKELITEVHKKYPNIILIANSIGAFFSMNALSRKQIKQAYFISPIVNMEKLIGDMMNWANVSEKELQEKKVIATDFGEDLSYEYLTYVRNHPMEWDVPTSILYGSADNLTSLDTMESFANATGSALTVMPNGEHWFHTEEQLSFLEQWMKECVARGCK